MSGLANWLEPLLRSRYNKLALQWSDEADEADEAEHVNFAVAVEAQFVAFERSPRASRQGTEPEAEAAFGLGLAVASLAVSTALCSEAPRW